MVAAIVSGHEDLSDILFLIAVIVFCIVAVIRLRAQSTDAALVATGLAAVALGWLVQ